MHRQLRRERLNRIRFLVDRRQRLLLIHDKTATAIERIRKSINNKRLTQVQTRGSFERKQTELEVRRHKLVLCLEAANAADEERKEATQRRMAALEEEETALAVSLVVAPSGSALPQLMRPPLRLIHLLVDHASASFP